ncbi:MAG: dTDP-4-dehydrorhamnose reductase [Syntrophobacteraceae bacterium]
MAGLELSGFRATVLGSRGMLARDLIESLVRSGCTAAGFDLPEVDITNEETIKASLLQSGHPPEVVINCAAYTAVDKAETDPEIAYAVNAGGPEKLAGICTPLKIPVIHISTDYVFDGHSPSPYREEDTPYPLSIYGKSKLDGEIAIRSNASEYLILRTAWLYGVHGQNFVKTILRLAREREELRIVSDQRGSPTWTQDLANAITLIISNIATDRVKIPWGTYHFCNTGETTWYDFARAIVEEAQLYETLKVRRILPISTGDYPLPAKRPANSALDCRRISTTFKLHQPPWRQSLAAMVKALLSGDKSAA